MGAYTDNLTRRNNATKAKAATERLVSAALIRDGVIEARGFKSHWQIRAALGDEDPTFRNPDDEEGFLTSAGRFVTRQEAKSIGEAAGQCRPTVRELLSSDIDW